jgi:CHAT domain-containing protein/tetratricopeptide (TPR) repeat protein
MLTLALLLQTAPASTPPPTADVPRLAVGQPLHGRIEKDDPPLASSQLPFEQTGSPLHGRSFPFVVTQGGTYSIEMRSHWFDSYLILRAADGRVVAEDDDGLFGDHARIVEELAAGEYRVDAGAVGPRSGPFELTVAAGRPPQLSDEEQCDLALRDAREAVAELESSPEGEPLVVHALARLADLLRLAERRIEAAATVERALAIARRHGPESVEWLSPLGVRLEMDERGATYETTKADFEQILRILDGDADAGQALGVDLLERYASFLEQHWQVPGSVLLGHRQRELVLERVSKDPQCDELDVAEALSSLGANEVMLWRDVDSERTLRRALEIFESKAGPDDLRTARAREHLFSCHYKFGKFDRAEPLERAALAQFERVLGWDDEETLNCAAELSEVLELLGRFPEALELGLRVDQTRRRLTAQEILVLPEHRQSYWVESSQKEQQAVLTIARALGDADSWRRAYESVLGWKGLVGRTLGAVGERIAARQDPEQRKLLAEIEQIDGQLARARGDATLASQELRARRILVESKLRAAQGGASVRTETTVAELAAALPPKTALVDLLSHPWYRPTVVENGAVVKDAGWTEPHLSAWVLVPGASAPAHVDLGETSGIHAAIAAFVVECQKARGAGVVAPAADSADSSDGRRTATQRAEAALVEACARLRQLLWDPIAPLVGANTTVLLSPDGAVGRVPFEILAQADGRFLVEERRFVYLHDFASLPSLVESQRATPPLPRFSKLLLVGDVDFDRRVRADGVVAAAPPPADRSRGTIGAELRSSPGLVRWKRLPGMAREIAEVEGVHARARRGSERLTLSGADATETRVKREMERFDVVHFATHGFFEPSSESANAAFPARDVHGDAIEAPTDRAESFLPGIRSGVVCAGANDPRPDDEDDGLLTAADFAFLDLRRVALVVASACETGLGDTRSAEGMVGLRSVLRQRGVRTVVSSTWKVDDDATCQLMTAFYRNLWERSRGPLDALRDAQLEMLERNRRELHEPRVSTWGAFVLDGAWE